jgi:hypothetical protein
MKIAPWYIRGMTRRPAIGHLLALLAVVGLMLAPLAHATMAMGTADDVMPGHVMADHAAPDHGMLMADMGAVAGMEMTGLMADMPCCPHKAPVPDCGGDCPFMALCSAMPFGVPLVSLAVPPAEAGVVRPGDQSGLTGLTRPPPRRPPKHPGSPAVAV